MPQHITLFNLPRMRLMAIALILALVAWIALYLGITFAELEHAHAPSGADVVIVNRSFPAKIVHFIATGEAGADSGAYGYQYCGYGNYVYNNGTDRDEYYGGYWVDLYTRNQGYNHWYKLWPWESGQTHFWHSYRVNCQP